MLKSAIVAACLVAIGSTASFAQGGAGGEPPRLGDANPPRNALRNGGVNPTAAMRRGDDMAPLAGQSSGWNGSYNRTWNNGWRNDGWNGGWRSSWDNGWNGGYRTGWNSWNGGWNGWNSRNVSDPSFGSRGGINAARRTGRCVEDLGYGRFEYCGW